jgi:GAF domain-containing protein
MQCPRCQQDNPAHAKFCLECGAPFGRIHEVSKPAVPYEEVQRALSEALEQQTATAEILRVISRSPNDVQPVFDSIAASALRLCDAKLCTTFTFDGELIHLVASHHVTEEGAAAYRDAYPSRPGRASGTHRAILTRTIVHIPDIREDPEYELRALARANDYGCVLAVPMLRDGHPVGAITVGREAARPFPSEQIALLRTFAQQAVIAIENVRLFNETKEALERQTATSEILRVISSSPTDTQPVFDTIAANAAQLCAARDAQVLRVEGDVLRLVSAYGSPSMPPVRSISRGHAVGRAVIDRLTIHVRDMTQAVRDFPETSAPQHGVESVLAVPLLRNEVAVGVIRISRTQVQPFTEAQITLLQTFAAQAVVAIENVRLFTELQEKNRALTEAHATVTEALEQQTATSEILRVISSSPTDVQPTFEAIAASSRRLCEAAHGMVFRFDGDLIHLAAHDNLGTEQLDALRSVFPIRPGRGSVTARAILTRSLVHVRDRREDPELEYSALSAKFPNTLSVPLLREGVPLGAITVTRAEVARFSHRQIALLQTFADQAVIAIENVRLFTELQAKNQALTEAHAQVTEALEQQTATAEILRVISQSQTDVQPVFDTIVRSAARLCHAPVAGVFLIDGRMVHHLANYGTSPEALAVTRSWYPRPVEMDSTPGMAILTRSVVQVPDIEDPSALELVRQIGRGLGFRSSVGVPMLREGDAVGAIIVNRREPGRFSDAEVELLKTFAAQAVIAVENVRLFTELQASNRGLIAALDTQTATSDILRVISRSQTNVQPVFDAILGSAVLLLRGYSGVMTRLAGDQIELAALTSTDDAGDAATRAAFPQSDQSDGLHAQATRDRAPINITDAQTDPRASEAVRANARARGNRSWVIVPLLRHDEAVGTLAVTRREPGGFTDDEIALLKTFADQAVIAIENARLLTELQARTQELSRSVGELQALGEVGQAISSTLDLETVLTTIVSRAVQLSALDGGVVFEYDEGTEEFVQRAGTDPGGALAEARRTTRIRKGEGVLGRTAITLEPIQVPDITVPAAYEGRLREILVESGVRAILAVPMVREGRLIGCLGVTRNQPGEFPAETIELLRTFATQSALAIQNARLFHEIEDKSRQLEAASRHKSEFLANMSHELRTPLNAVIGFSEVLLQRMFGALNEKQDEYLKDIYASGQHLLSLINDILDLSKIEAGRMELAPAPFHLPSALENAVTLVRERAARHGIALHLDLDPRLDQLVGDERKVKQVLLNLLSNAVKFTPEGGRISLKAGRRDGAVEISVTDTGIGIAPEDQAAIFEEFRQVGSDETRKQEGTGLGLTLAKKFVELHGGRIWVESKLGTGSTFTFTLPVS